MKNNILLSVLFSFWSLLLLAQNPVFDQKSYDPPVLTGSDFVVSGSLPELKLSPIASKTELPYRVDNSHQPFLRPVFNQAGASCGQATGIGYNFTYEWCRSLNLLADTSIHQFPTHFAWNFMNGGSGYYGVSYIHSFEILKALGTPSVFQYGGMAIDNGSCWLSGYDLYYQAMKHRIREVYQLDVGTPEGLNVLKHWLHNHNEGSEVGGVASFYANSPWAYKYLPPQSPDSGKAVIMNFFASVATHGMTIIGYNDSIRYDYNEDGQFTNNLDINGDGDVNMKDWEIGGVKFVNSYGENWADSGYCYMMYKVLADELADGGIWNHVVHVLDVNEDYTPLLTMKLAFRHNSREKIKIIAGVTTDTSLKRPDEMLAFNVFNFQGGHQFMQGGSADPERQNIEIGLDITPLLGFVKPGQPAKFFAIITEDDPKSEGSGLIYYCSVVDYTSGINEIACAQTNVPITENGTTRLSVVHTPVFSKAQIAPDELPATINQQPYSQQMTASGGQPGYRWDLLTPYHQQPFEADFPVIDEQLLTPSPPYHIFTEVVLDFDFPFYDSSYHKVFVHQGGFLMFDNDLYPWPYYNDPFLLFKKMRNISVFHFGTVEYYPEPFKDDDGVYYEGNEDYAAFRWKHDLWYYDQNVGHGEFAVIIYPDGKIEYHYNDIWVTEDIIWYAGVSAGNNSEYKLFSKAMTNNIPGHSSFRMIPELIPDSFSMDENGLLTGFPEPGNDIHNLNIQVMDDLNISTTKTLQLSDGLIFNYLVDAGADSLVQYGETIFLDFEVKNISPAGLHNINVTLESDDPNLQMLQNSAAFGSLGPGVSLRITHVFELKISENCPDNYTFVIPANIDCDEDQWNGTIHFTSHAPAIRMFSYQIQDDNNQKLDPGETASLIIDLTNDGSAEAQDVMVTLSTNDPFVQIENPAQIIYGVIESGNHKEMAFTVTALASTPISHKANFEVEINWEPQQTVSDSLTLTIGQWPVLLVNRAQNNFSSSKMEEAFNALGVEYTFVDQVPADLGIYRSIFICLGTFYQNHILLQEEGAWLRQYLIDGGKLYLEGTTTWYIDPQTPVHQMFNTGIQTINWVQFNQQVGFNGTFTEGMVFDFIGQYNYQPCKMIPTLPAFAILSSDGDLQNITAVANHYMNYKTIGSMFEFGSLGDETCGDERRELMRNMLVFFDLEDYITQIGDEDHTCSHEVSVTCFPNPFKNEVNIHFYNEESFPSAILIFDMKGRLITSLDKFNFSGTGQCFTNWDGTDDLGQEVPQGVYYYRFSVGKHTFTGKIVKVTD